MSQRTTFYLLTTCILFLSLLAPGSVSAQDGKFALRLWGQVSPFISGEAGSGTGAPDYDDAFKSGLGAGVELSWRFSDRFGGLAGIGYENWNGKSVEGISFDNLKVVPVYLGGKFYFMSDRTGWNPYLRMDVGAAHLSSVDVSYLNLNGKYWDSSWVFLFDAGAGVEYRWGKWGASLEVRPRYLGKPDSHMGSPSNAGSSWSVPIVMGINYHF